MALRQMLKVRQALLHLLREEIERGTQFVQYAYDGKIVFWDKNHKLYVEDQYEYLFDSETPQASSLRLHIETFVSDRKTIMRTWGLKHPDVVNYVNKTYDMLMGIISQLGNSYSPTETLVVENRDTIYKVSRDGERHFVTHINPINEYIPLSRYDIGEEPIDIRVALDTLHMLQCCFNPSKDHEYNSKRKQAQEDK